MSIVIVAAIAWVPMLLERSLGWRLSIGVGVVGPLPVKAVRVLGVWRIVWVGLLRPVTIRPTVSIVITRGGGGEGGEVIVTATFTAVAPLFVDCVTP